MAHQRAGHQRTDTGADPVGGQEHRRQRDPARLLDVVVGQRHRQRIEGEQQHAGNEPVGQQQPVRQRHQPPHRDRGQAQQHRIAADQPTAVEAVGQPTQRPLRTEAGDDAHADEETRLRGIQAVAVGVDRRQAVEGADHQAGDEDGAQRLRHALPEETHFQRRGDQLGRVHAPGHGQRDQARGEADGDQQQRLVVEGRAQRQQALAEHQAKVDGDHVAGEHLAALVALGLLVEPALDHHVLVHHHRAGDEAQQQPDFQLIDQGMQQHGHGGNPGASHVGTDMAEAGDQLVSEFSTADQAEIVGRHQPADPQVACAFLGQAQADVGGEQAGAGQHEQGGGVERGKGDERAEHDGS